MPLTTFDIDLDMITAIVIAIITIAGLFKAIKDIRTLGWKPFKEKWITPRQTRRKRLDQVLETVAEIQTTLTRVDNELRTNGGTSLKDRVVRIDEKVEHIQARVKHQDETATVPIFELDSRGGMRFCNAAFCRLIGADEKDLLHRDYVSRIHPTQRTAFLQQLAEAIDNKMPLDVPGVIFRPIILTRGHTKPIHVRANPDVRPDGTLMGFFGTAIYIEECLVQETV